MDKSERRRLILEAYSRAGDCKMPASQRSPGCIGQLHADGDGFDLDHIKGRKKAPTKWGVGAWIVHASGELNAAILKAGDDPIDYLSGVSLQVYLAKDLMRGIRHLKKVRAVCRPCNLHRRKLT